MSEAHYYSTQTVADVLSVSKKTIRGWAVTGKLNPVKVVNSEYFYNKDQLAQFNEFKGIFESNWEVEHAKIPHKSYKLLELFAGCGGLALGMKRAGFESIMISDFDKHCCNTLKANNLNWNVIESDICDIDFTIYKGNVDILTGGFPCQPFSYAGNQKGFNDARGSAFFEFARAIKEVEPSVVLIENVKGLVTSDGGKTLEVIIKTLTDLGYSIKENYVYKAMLYKVPQKRERLIIVAVKNSLSHNLQYKRPSVYNRVLSVKDALKKGVMYNVDVPQSKGQQYSEKKKEVLSLIPQGGYWKDLPVSIQKEYLMGSYYLSGGKTGIARRLSWLEPSLTLTCSPSQKQTERCHPDETRPLTIREYARIQSFPDEWLFTGSVSSQYKQIGNAVPPNLAEAIGRALIRMLEKK